MLPPLFSKFEIYLSDDTGVIQSSLYPDSYEANADISTRIESKDGHQIELTFDFFELQESQDCESDYLAIYDGPDATSTLLGKFCGKNSPERIISSGNFLFIVFKTDSSIEDKGYYGTYKFATKCRLIKCF